ncbi:MAG: hypothetical protein ACRDNS_10990 [Trebonia sp.]
MADYDLKTTKSRAKDAFGAPLADMPVNNTKRAVGPDKSSFKRAIDKVARTLSGREETWW